MDIAGIQDSIIALALSIIAIVVIAAQTLKAKLFPVKTADPNKTLIGVSITKMWDGYRYVEQALVNWDEWIAAYGWSKVDFTYTPPGLMTVEFVDRKNGFSVYYDKIANMLYANDAPQFLKEDQAHDKAVLDAQWKAINAASSPVLAVYAILGEVVRSAAVGNLTGDNAAIAWANICDGKTPDDLAFAQKIFCEVTGYKPEA